MPKDTFFRIKEDRRNRIFNAAVHEFSEYGYSDASVNRILKEAHIAAGSFYQYFEDMKDLFYHVVYIMVGEKNKYIKAEVQALKDPDFETMIKALYRGGIKFAVENEPYVKLGNHFMRLQHTEMYHELIRVMPQDEIFNWLNDRIAKAIERGEVKDGVTPTLFMMLFMSVNTTIVEYLMMTSKANDFDPTKLDLDVFSEMAVNLFLKGVLNKGGNL